MREEERLHDYNHHAMSERRNNRDLVEQIKVVEYD